MAAFFISFKYLKSYAGDVGRNACRSSCKIFEEFLKIRFYENPIVPEWKSGHTTIVKQNGAFLRLFVVKVPKIFSAVPCKSRGRVVDTPAT
jgi:hypothetical protein